MVIVWLLAAGCGGEQHSSPPVAVSGGWIHQDPSLPGEPIGSDGRVFTPAGSVTPMGAREVAAPSCVPVFTVELGDVDRHTAMGGSAPDTAMAFSPSGRHLAIGTFLGEVILVDAWTGATLARRRLAETMVKQVAWSSDGSTLYVGEQSPDGSLLALSIPTLEETWRVNLSDWVGDSPLPAGNLYGAYTLPAAYGLDVLADGSLLVVATHAWTIDSGERLNRSVVLKLGSDGRPLAQWPEQPADAVFFRTQLAGDVALIPVSRSSDGPHSGELPIGGALVFDLHRFEPTASIRPQPLEPWFTNTFLWEALDVRGDTVFLGLGDGRAGLWSLDGQPKTTLPSAGPIMAGETPVVASIGSGMLHGERAVYITSSTHIPFGAAAPELKPLAAHPNENTLISADASGRMTGSWSGPHRLQGLAMMPDGRHLVVGAGQREHDQRQDLFGALVFDLGPEDAPLDRPLLSRFCQTEGPVFFRAAATLDGRIAVTEHPYRHGEDPAFGDYRVTVFR